MTEQNETLRTIRETNESLRAMVETREVIGDKFWLGGIVSQVYQSHLGHTYFTLEDEGFSISCKLGKNLIDKAIFVNKGVVLDVYGAIRVYEKQAQLQIQVADLRLAQPNKISFSLEVIEQLKGEGLYPRPKRELPQPPQSIALITSKRSDALQDFEDIYRREKGKAAIKLFDVLLQGDTAPAQIAERIAEANRNRIFDVIVIIRGGGRNIDLATFNDIRIARAICESRLPVVTGIGHQRDETLADRLADESTITPTEAAYRLAKLEPQNNPIVELPSNSSGFLQQNLLGLIIILIALAIILFLIFQIISLNN